MSVEIAAMMEKPATDALATARTVGPRGVWLKLVNEVLSLAGPHAELLSHSERPWSSVTFTGTRHLIALAFPGSDAPARVEAYREALPEHEFAIARHFVADAAISFIEHEATGRGVTVHTELLVLEDA
jgi:hypothetical protein